MMTNAEHVLSPEALKEKDINATQSTDDNTSTTDSPQFSKSQEMASEPKGINQAYDLAVVASLDTLLGVDCLELAYRASQQYIPPVDENERPRYKIQLLGIKGGWDASLDSSNLYRINTEWLHHLGELKRNGTATYKNWQNLAQEPISLNDIATDTLLLCLPKGNVTAHLLKARGKHIIELADVPSRPLEALGEWLNISLLPLEEAHATYFRDYLPGLSFQGIPLGNLKQLNNSEGTDNHQPKGEEYSPPSVVKILNREREFQSCPPAEACTEIKIDKHWRGMHLDAKSEEGKQKAKLAKDVCLYLIDEKELKKEKENSEVVYAFYKQRFLEELDSSFCQTMYKDAAKNHTSLTMPTNLVLYCSDQENDTKAEDDPLTDQLNRVERIEFTTSKPEGEALQAIKALPEIQGLADIKVIHGTFSQYFRADIVKKENTDSRTVVDLIVDHLLGVCLNHDRPLVSYGSTFFLPFRLSTHNQELENHLIKSTYDYKAVITAESADAEVHKARCGGRGFKFKVQNSQLQENEGERFNVIANERDAFLYLDPVIRERFFHLDKCNGQKISELRADISPDDELDNRHHLIWGFHKETTKPWVINKSIWLQATIRNISLRKFYNDVYILHINVYERFFHGETSLTSKSTNWWHDLFSKSELKQRKIEESSIKHWLTYTDHIRQIYPSFAIRGRDEGDEISFYFGHKNEVCDTNKSKRELNFNDLTNHNYQVPEDFCRIFKKLGINNVNELRFKPFIDNRLFTNTIYGLAGNAQINESSRKKYNALYSLAAYIDQPKDAWSSLGGYVYDPKFTEDLLEGQTYKRWAAMGNRYAFTDYSNVYVGYGEEFNNNIAPCHVFYDYQNMLLMALFYRESLHDFSERVSEISKQIDTVSQSEFRKIRQDFIRFTNVSWFQELSSQIQGKEIYNKIIDGLDIKKEYEFLEKEISATYQHFQATTAHRFTMLTFIFAIATLLGGAYNVYSSLSGGEGNNLSPWGAPVILAFLLVTTLSKNLVFRSFPKSLRFWGQSFGISRYSDAIYWLFVFFIAFRLGDIFSLWEWLTNTVKYLEYSDLIVDCIATAKEKLLSFFPKKTG